MSGAGQTIKKDNLACRLDSEIGSSNTIASEIAKTTDMIREALMGLPPSVPTPMNKESKESLDGSRPGFLGKMTDRSENTNSVLNHALDELRIILGEIS